MLEPSFADRLEVLWRWVYGIPALWLIFLRLRRVLAAHTAGTYDPARLGLDSALLNDPVGALTADPLGAVSKLTQAIDLVLPDLKHLAIWLVPLLVAIWIVVSSIGRTAVLRRADNGLLSKPWTVMLLQAVRLAALAGSFWLWFACIEWAARTAITSPIASGDEPNLVLYCAITIVTTLGLFVLWGFVSWIFSIVPLLAMLEGSGVLASLAAALRLGPLKSKLVEINLVMGIVKIALIVLAMVFSATPLPFESVTTPGFLAWWWAGVTLLYLVGSDFFHVVRLVAYLNLWRAYEGVETPRTKKLKGASYGQGCHSTETRSEAMSFALYGVGLLVLVGGLVYVAVLSHVHSQWIVAMVIILLGAGLMAAVNNTKPRDSK